MPIEPANDSTIARAGRLLREGALVAFPTETVYGLGADATNAMAVARIYEAKGRPHFNPLIAHVPDIVAARRLGRFSPMAERLAAALWPGPLSLVVAKATDCPVSDLALAGLDTIAVRVPGHAVARSILAAAGVPIAAPSANRSGRVSPTTAAHVADELGDACALIVDGGPTHVGLESTIVDATGDAPVLLRPGAVTRAEIANLLRCAVRARLHADTAPTAPGQLPSHYAPRARVRLRATSTSPGEALLAFGPTVPVHDGPMLNLSPTGDAREAAIHLFAYLRALDASGAATIAVMPIPGDGPFDGHGDGQDGDQDSGLGEAINDRLRRAAAPR